MGYPPGRKRDVRLEKLGERLTAWITAALFVALFVGMVVTVIWKGILGG